MSADRALVKVQIGTEEYSLRSDRPEEYTRAVAEHVDRALREILASGAIIETHKAAVLTALAIADELFQERRTHDEMADRIARLSAELARLLPPAKRRSTAAFASSADDT
ncbi:MAG: cell division protein ZapA [Gemmatimonadota bacterium]|nr:cell division protein ZapA [Gemmatimonadota bacterium]